MKGSMPSFIKEEVAEGKKMPMKSSGKSSGKKSSKCAPPRGGKR